MLAGKRLAEAGGCGRCSSRLHTRVREQRLQHSESLCDPGVRAGLGGAARWKANLLQQAAAAFAGRSKDLAAHVYSATAVVQPGAVHGKRVGRQQVPIEDICKCSIC